MAGRAPSDERGKVSARLAPTQAEPILSRFGLGADGTFQNTERLPLLQWHLYGEEYTKFFA